MFVRAGVVVAEYDFIMFIFSYVNVLQHTLLISDYFMFWALFFKGLCVSLVVSSLMEKNNITWHY